MRPVKDTADEEDFGALTESKKEARTEDIRQLVRRWSWGIGILALFIITLWKLETLSTLVLLSLLVAYLLNPLVTRMDRLRFINRTGATAITLCGLLVAILAVFFVILPGVIGEFRTFIDKVPGQLEVLQTRLIPWVETTFNMAVPTSFNDAVSQFGKEINEYAPKVIGPATQFVARAFRGTFSVVIAVLGALMFPLFLFFLLKDFPRVVASVDGLIPRNRVRQVHDFVKEADKSLSAFLHGQFMVMLVLGTLYSIGYSVVGIPVAVGVGLLTGMLCFIPYVGAATGFILALLLAFLDFQGFGRVIGVCVVFAVVQLLDATIITPRILGGKLGLRPLWIIVALMAGGELFGFLGVLLAVPATAVLKVVVSHSVEHYKKSRLYSGSAR